LRCSLWVASTDTNAKTYVAVLFWFLPRVRWRSNANYVLSVRTLSFFQLDGFAVPALVVQLVVEPVETLSRHSTGLCPERVYPLRGR
jgi:hypothetical protein